MSRVQETVKLMRLQAVVRRPVVDDPHVRCTAKIRRSLAKTRRRLRVDLERSLSDPMRPVAVIQVSTAAMSVFKVQPPIVHIGMPAPCRTRLATCNRWADSNESESS